MEVGKHLCTSSLCSTFIRKASRHDGSLFAASCCPGVHCNLHVVATALHCLLHAALCLNADCDMSLQAERLLQRLRAICQAENLVIDRAVGSFPNPCARLHAQLSTLGCRLAIALLECDMLSHAACCTLSDD